MNGVFRLALVLLQLFLCESNAIENKPWPAVPTFSDQEIEGYLLKSDHPARPILDKLFSNPELFQNEKKFTAAGFQILHYRPSTLIIASHPELEGYLVKMHLRDSARTPFAMWDNFFKRCSSARNVQKFIQENKLRYFEVAEKWIYLPAIENPLPILLVTRMDTVTKKESKEMWRNGATKKQIKELFSLVSRGYVSTSLPSNLPWTKKGKFALVDTECLQRIPHYDHAAKHFSEKNKVYWEKLIKEKT